MQTSDETSVSDVQNPQLDQQPGEKRSAEVDPEGQPLTKKSTFAKKVKPLPEQGSFYKPSQVVKTVPSVEGLIRLVDDIVKAWKHVTLRCKLGDELVRAVLLAQLRECVEAYLSELHQRKYPDIRIFTQCHTVELPPIIASLVGKLGPHCREHYPDIVINVAEWLQCLDYHVRDEGYRYASEMEILQTLPVLKKATSDRNSAWVLPIKGDSLIGSGVFVLKPPAGMENPPPDTYYPVNAMGGSRRTELWAGYLRFREFGRVGNCFFPHYGESESDARVVLASNTVAAREWNKNEFIHDLFGPVMTGQKQLTN
jgi:hypothetical protein